MWMYYYSWNQWITFFFIYSFLGWVWESCYVSLKKRKWINRGFLKGPLLPIYGSGAIVVLVSTIMVQNNTFLIFIIDVTSIICFFFKHIIQATFY